MRSTFLTLVFVVTSALAVQSKTIVSGKVTGDAGKELVKAIVILRQPFDTTAVRAAEVGGGGLYELAVPSPGVWIILFRGVHYADQEVALYVGKEKRIGLDVSLGTYSYLESFENVKAFGSFNNWYRLSAIPLKKQPGGEYTATVKTSSPSVSYRLLGVRRGGSMEGTQDGSYVYKGSLGYVSVVDAKDGSARIVFDPGKLVRPESASKVRFVDAPIAARFNSIYTERVNFENAFRTAFRAQMSSRGRDPKNVKFDFSDVVSSITGQLEKEEEPVLRQELYFNYLNVYVIGQQIDPSFFTKVLDEIPPSSAVWSLGPNNIYYALIHSSLSDEKQDTYVRRIVAENPVRRVKSILLFDEFMSSKLQEDKEKAAHYYEHLVNNFGDTPEGKYVSKTFTAPKMLAKGSRVPSFSIPSSDNMVELITDKSLRGKYSLILFWAAEDPQSVEEIGYVEKAYGRLRDSNLNILTISVDSLYSDVVRFREKHRMPWMNAYVGKNRDNAVVKAFRAYDVPEAFLIDPSGMIIDKGKDLVGKQLEKTLRKYLGD